jgi:hypothetical protein
MRTEVRAAIAYVLRGRIQNLEEQDPHENQALLARLALLKEGLNDLEQPPSPQRAVTPEEATMTNGGPLYTGGEV